MLLIAPNIGTDWQERTVREISAALRPVVLQGNVSYEDVVSALRRQEWREVWILAHGTSDGIVVSRGDGYAGSMAAETLIRADTLVSLVRTSGAKLVVMASCQSAEVGLWIHAQTHATVICTVGDVEQRSAYETLTLFAEQRKRGKSVRDAFEAAKPGDAKTAQEWRIFDQETAENGDATALHILKAIDMALAPLRAQLERLEHQIDRRVDDLETRINEIDGRTSRKIAQIQLDVDNLSDTALRFSPVRRVAWVAGALLFAAPFFIGSAVALADVGHPWEWFVPSGLLVLLLAIGLLMYGLGFVRGEK